MLTPSFPAVLLFAYPLDQQNTSGLQYFMVKKQITVNLHTSKESQILGFCGSLLFMILLMGVRTLEIHASSSHGGSLFI
jgi:hypothetical protein